MSKDVSTQSWGLDIATAQLAHKDEEI